MFSRRNLPLIFGICIALGLLPGGCGQPNPVEAPPAQVERPADPAAVTPEKAEPAVETEPVDPEVSDGPGGESPVPSEPAEATYAPPFPDRLELFVAPKRQGRGLKSSPDGLEKEVELLGFVNVDTQRAVLSIDGSVSRLAVGSLEAGVEVISIQPPAVVLQRGRQRWQATLEN